MKNILKILMIEDVEEDAELIERSLKKANFAFISKRVDTREEFTQALKEFGPDVILSDHSLPQFNYSEALTICQNQNIWAPFILVSEEFAVSNLKQGADDYILKANLTRLPSAIQNALNKRIAEADIKKTEESILEQNLQLIKINQELDRFVYSASHDLRAPLKSILGLVNLALHDLNAKEYGELEEVIQMIGKSISKLDFTIKDIINYSRNTRIEIYTEEIKLNELVHEVFENLQYLEGAEKVEKEIQIMEAIPLISDSSRLKVILNNIISNAIKYHDPKKEKPFISFAVNVDEKKALIEIKDNGIGIDAAFISKIFNMFYRGTEKSEGSGLGLYIVKETLDKLNGTIKVNSIVDQGTSFIIEIPNIRVEHGN